MEGRGRLPKVACRLRSGGICKHTSQATSRFEGLDTRIWDGRNVHILRHLSDNRTSCNATASFYNQDFRNWQLGIPALIVAKQGGSKVARMLHIHYWSRSVFPTGQSVRLELGRGRTTFCRPVPSSSQIARAF